MLFWSLSSAGNTVGALALIQQQPLPGYRWPVSRAAVQCDGEGLSFQSAFTQRRVSQARARRFQPPHALSFPLSPSSPPFLLILTRVLRFCMNPELQTRAADHRTMAPS
ncbi:hypothetical protein KOW79_001984 [Hemibagrus wyckioides]|uniref:Uncharacterized protein n=1 Tax=Hemibagrus wyckioides TaxID=337641 RepID=A0A9D3SY77_9TELE|nr:hypothetical protein KOW79_001984 [Hemibagrus wyckioides]